MYVFASIDAHVAHLNMNSQKHEDVQPIQKMNSGNKLILDRVTFDINNWIWKDVVVIYVVALEAT